MNAAAQLDQEWPTLAQRQLKDALPAWQRDQRVLRSFTSPQQLLCFLHSNPPAGTNAPLLALLTLARDDRLAGRFLLQAILPALKSQVTRIVYPLALRDEVWELLLFYAWEAICTYPTERRRRSVAANLVLQVLHDTTRELRRTDAHRDDEETGRHYDDALGIVPATNGALWLLIAPDRPVGTDPIDAETFLLAAARGGWIAERDAELILQNRVDGIPLRIVAQASGVGYEALRKRRQRAERQLRRLLTGNPMSPLPYPRTPTSSTRGKPTAGRRAAQQRLRRMTPPARADLSPANARKETTMRRRAIFAAACTYTTLTVLVMAQDALAATDLNTVIGNLKLWLTGLLAGLATVFLITGAGRYVMAGGDPMKIEKAKSAISSAGLGYAFALFAPIAVTIIQQIVGG